MIELNRDQQERVLKLARKTIADDLGIETQIEAIETGDDIFTEKCGAFVTIHISGNLRGCIGYIVGVKSIPETVIEMAKSAAFKDPRFSPLKKEEYNLIDLEVSVLSPIERVSDVVDIVTGRDGLIISRGSNQGLLLPQVATEQGWDRDAFLEHTCYKAGLPGSAWRDSKTKIEKFSAQVFGEIELGLLS